METRRVDRYTGKRATGASWAAISLAEFAFPTMSTRWELRVSLGYSGTGRWSNLSFVAFVWARPGNGMSDFAGLLALQFLETWYVRKVRVIEPHGRDDHRVPGLFQDRPAIYIPVFHANRPSTATLDFFYADDLMAQTHMPARDEGLCECLEVRVRLC